MAEMKKVIARVISQRGVCTAGHRVGDEFPVGEMTPPNVCSFAYCAVWPFALALQSGGSFPWETEPGATTVACPDPDSPLVIELRRVDG